MQLVRIAVVLTLLWFPFGTRGTPGSVPKVQKNTLIYCSLVAGAPKEFTVTTIERMPGNSSFVPTETLLLTFYADINLSPKHPPFTRQYEVKVSRKLDSGCAFQFDVSGKQFPGLCIRAYSHNRKDGRDNSDLRTAYTLNHPYYKEHELRHPVKGLEWVTSCHFYTTEFHKHFNLSEKITARQVRYDLGKFIIYGDHDGLVYRKHSSSH